MREEPRGNSPWDLDWVHCPVNGLPHKPQIGNVAYVAVGTSTVRACMANGLNPPCSANVTVSAYIAPVTATIEGLTTVPRLALCTWTSTVNGGTPPFTYTWTPANQAIPATGPVYKKSTPATGPLRITLSVRDVNGLTGGTSKNITLTPPAGACPK
jgi:hypothetical protein